MEGSSVELDRGLVGMPVLDVNAVAVAVSVVVARTSALKSEVI